MQEVYRVTIHGKILESRNLRQLLSRAVAEKRNMDQKMRMLSHRSESGLPGLYRCFPTHEASRRV